MLQEKPKKFSTAPVEEKVEAICNWLEEKKAANLLALDLTGLQTFTDNLIIVTASSMRHAQALSEYVMMMCKKTNYEYMRVEGQQTGQWILLDLNDIVVNIFLQDVRSLFNLESLWADAKVIRESASQPVDEDEF